MTNDEEKVTHEPDPTTQVLRPLGTIIRVLWLGTFITVAVTNFGSSGESGLAVYIFLSILSFPSSMLLSRIPIFNPNFIGSFSFFFLAVLFAAGYFQWFVLPQILIRKIRAFSASFGSREK